MKKALLLASTVLLTTSGVAMAGDYPSFSDADKDGNGNLDTQELRAALPGLEFENHTVVVSAADIKRAMPEVDFTDKDVVNLEPIGEEQYAKIVSAMDGRSLAERVSN